MSKKQLSASPSPNTPEPRLQPGELPDVSNLPRVPKGYVPLDVQAKQSLVKIPATQRAEVQTALKTIATKYDTLEDDLGKFAPLRGKSEEILAHMTATHAVSTTMAPLAAYIDDEELRAQHAAMTFVNAVAGSIEFAATLDPEVRDRYEDVLVVAAQRSDAIVEGISRSKATKQLKAQVTDAEKALEKMAAPEADKATAAKKATD